MKIYFLRHGETMWNREKLIQGRTPFTELTEFGIRLAELTRSGMNESGLTFDRIYSSPLKRAVQTAEILADGKAIVIDEHIVEMDFGVYEGTHNAVGKYVDDNIRSFFDNPSAFVPHGGESLSEVEERFVAFLKDEIAPLEGRVDNILVISHGGALRLLIKWLMKLPKDEYWFGRQPNCCVHIAECKDGDFSLIEASRVYYDPKVAEGLPSV